jgi:ABC-type nitrate/sulfonate/bicarbonate transport system substrate-binding protein
VAVSQDMIDKHPDVLKRWLAATSETISTLQANEGKAVDVLKEYFKEDNPQVLKAVYKDFIMNIHPNGIMKKEWMQDSLQAAEFFGDKDPLSLDKIFSSAFTPIEPR